MAKRRATGETLQSIASDYGVTRERVRQLTPRLTADAKRAMRYPNDYTRRVRPAKPQAPVLEALRIGTFGCWTVVKIVSGNGNGHQRVLCRCECGREDEVVAVNLTRGMSTRCSECWSKAQSKRMKAMHEAKKAA